MLQEFGLVEQQAVGGAAQKILGEDFVEALDVRRLHGIDVVPIEFCQDGKV